MYYLSLPNWKITYSGINYTLKGVAYSEVGVTVYRSDSKFLKIYIRICKTLPHFRLGILLYSFIRFIKTRKKCSYWQMHICSVPKTHIRLTHIRITLKCINIRYTLVSHNPHRILTSSVRQRPIVYVPKERWNLK